MDPAAGDLRLRDGSPAIDAGTSESTSRGDDHDLDGVHVPQGGRVDIGAYESMP